MSELTLEEKARHAEGRARTQEAEKHFFDKNQPFFPQGFSVFQRGTGHWDISARQCPGKKEAYETANPGSYMSESSAERAFRIRGEPGNVIVMDERWDPHRPHPRESLKFRTVSMAMLWIVEELMQEPKET